jgi:hypothetical protein
LLNQPHMSPVRHLLVLRPDARSVKRGVGLAMSLKSHTAEPEKLTSSISVVA